MDREIPKHFGFLERLRQTSKNEQFPKEIEELRFLATYIEPGSEDWKYAQ